MDIKQRPEAYKKLTAITALISVMMLSSCGGHSIGESKSVTTTASQTTTTAPEAEPAAEEITTIAERTPEVEAVKYEKFSKTIEAELGALSGNVKSAKKREGYKGDGYITGFKEDGDKATLAFEAEKSQYYTVTLRAASDKGARCMISINGEARAVSIEGKEFANVDIPNLYLEAGAVSIDISFAEGSADIDRVTLKASEDIEKLDLTLKTATLSNKNADVNARALYEFLRENYGQKVILGQYDSIGTTIESDFIHKLTGKYPAIRFGDMMQFTTDNTTLAEADLEKAVQWHKDGGIVGLMWHWYSPCESSDYYAENTDFDLSLAVTSEKVAQLSEDEIKALVDDGKISAECEALIKDIDTVSQKLLMLKEENIAVLWRPLHEASNGYFWWGKDEKSYIWLWKLMYERMTTYHKLDNLIWVWSAQNAKWYVGDEYCDILSVDIYDKGNLSSQTDRLMFLRSINDKKPVAMSECGNFPAVDNLIRDKGMWSYIGQWGGNFLLNDEGKLEEGFNSLDNIIDVYNNSVTLTREELPDFTQLASDIEAADKKKEEEAKAKKEKEEKEEEKADSKEDKEKAEDKESEG